MIKTEMGSSVFEANKNKKFYLSAYHFSVSRGASIPCSGLLEAISPEIKEKMKYFDRTNS